MSLQIVSLNSGSNGNCYYVGNETEAVFIDAGLSCRETERRMSKLSLPMSRVKAVFISHEHTDHISGLASVANRYDLPVFVTPRMQQCGRIQVAPHHVMFYEPFQTLAIGNLRITAFPKLHDACDPHSFTVADESVTIGVFTDLGFPCKELIRHFKLCDAAFLEANYDEEMLRSGKYPPHLKNRIRGGHGHLSNDQAIQLLATYKPPYMTHLLPAHLSKENNCPKLVKKLFDQHAGSTTVTVASRYEASPLYYIKGRPSVVAAGPISMPAVQRLEMQMSLF